MRPSVFIRIVILLVGVLASAPVGARHANASLAARVIRRDADPTKASASASVAGIHHDGLALARRHSGTGGGAAALSTTSALLDLRPEGAITPTPPIAPLRDAEWSAACAARAPPPPACSSIHAG